MRDLKLQYEGIDKEKQELMKKIEKEIENRQIIEDQKRSLNDELDKKLKDKIQENEFLKKKALNIEKELKEVSQSKYHSQLTSDTIYSNYVTEICESVMDNMILAIQLNDIQECVKDYLIVEDEKLLISKQSNDSVKQWFNIISESYSSQHKSFSPLRFNAFVDKFCATAKEGSQLYKLYDQSFQTWKSGEKPKLFSALNNINKNSGITDELYEVNSVLDNMILILEVQEEMEKQINVDLTWIKKSDIFDNTVTSLASPTKLVSRDSYNEGNSKNFHNLNDIQTSDIFIRKYNNKLNRIKEALNPIEKIAANSLSIDKKFLEKILSLNQEIKSDSIWETQLVIELTTLFINTYNYSIYLYQQWYKAQID